MITTNSRQQLWVSICGFLCCRGMVLLPGYLKWAEDGRRGSKLTVALDWWTTKSCSFAYLGDCLFEKLQCISNLEKTVLLWFREKSPILLYRCPCISLCICIFKQLLSWECLQQVLLSSQKSGPNGELLLWAPDCVYLNWVLRLAPPWRQLGCIGL